MHIESVCRSKNGVNIYCYKNPSLHSFHISLFVKSGCMYEDEELSGITHFLEHIAIRNVNHLYEMKLYALLDSKGVEFNASTYSEMVQFYVGGASKNFQFGAEVISKVLSPITLPKSEIDSERKRIKAEIRESDDKTSLATFTMKKVFEGTSLSNSIVGTNKTIDRIGLNKLEEYRVKILGRKNIFFYVTGNFTESDIEFLKNRIEEYDVSSDLKNSNIAPIPRSFGKREELVYVKNADYTIIRFSFDLDMKKYSVAETDLLYDMLLSGYNAKLFIELSEKRGLFYDVSGATERYKNIGSLYFSFELQSKDLNEAVKMTVAVLNSVKRKRNVDADAMKAAYVDNAYMLYDDSRELNFTFGYDNHIMDEKYLSVEDRKNRYENVTSERLSEIAASIFRTSNLTVTIKGNKKKIDVLAIEAILQELDKEE